MTTELLFVVIALVVAVYAAILATVSRRQVLPGNIHQTGPGTISQDASQHVHVDTLHVTLALQVQALPHVQEGAKPLGE